MKINIRLLSLIVLLSTMFFADADAGSDSERDHNFIPPEGFVPSELVASQIAEAVLTSIYGKETIDRQKPLRAVLKDGVWTVAGTMKPGRKGGVALIEIAKSDARILRVTHGK